MTVMKIPARQQQVISFALLMKTGGHGGLLNNKSLSAFQLELEEQNVHLSTSKIKKLLITVGLWITESSRMIQELFSQYIGDGIEPAAEGKHISDELKISRVSVSVNLPYSSVVYKLENHGSNANRCARYNPRLLERQKA